MHRFELRSPKGGQGTTTVGAMIALNLARTGRHVHYAAPDSDDIYRVLGVAIGDAIRMQHGRGLITVTDSPDHADYTDTFDVQLADYGNRPGYAVMNPVIWVVQNCYLALTNLMAIDYPDVNTARDWMVAVIDHRRALSLEDMLRCTGWDDAITVSNDPVIARAVDAGILVGHRLPRVGALDLLTDRLMGSAA